MATRRRQRFVHAAVAWVLGAVLVLALVETATLELFFVGSLISFLVVVKLTAPFNPTPRWRRRLRWLVVVGLLGFDYFDVRRILDILPPGILGG